jgi:protein-tyrosine phosphatase-like protein/uncharacterized protein DUF3562
MDVQVDVLADDLTREFEPEIERDTVLRVVQDTFESLDDARIKSYVPILARRMARDRLRSLARRSA